MSDEPFTYQSLLDKKINEQFNQIHLTGFIVYNDLIQVDGFLTSSLCILPKIIHALYLQYLQLLRLCLDISQMG